MQKVKVQRYISGKRPDYAQYASSGEETDDDDFIDNRKMIKPNFGKLDGPPDKIAMAEQNLEDSDDDDVNDPRLRRLRTRRYEDEDDVGEERYERHRHIQQPEILESEESEKEELAPNEQNEYRRTRRISLGSESESDTELSDTEIEKRRQILKQKMLQHKKEEEVRNSNSSIY